MNLNFKDFSNLNLSETLSTFIGEQASEILNAEQNRLLFIVFDEKSKNPEIYCDEKIKKLFSFHKKDVKNLTNVSFSLFLENADSIITPLIVILRQTEESLKLNLSAQSHGELVLIDSAPNAHHEIILKEHAALKNFWINVQKQNAQNTDLNRFVEIADNSVFYDEQLFVPQSDMRVKSNIKLLGTLAKSFSAGCLLSNTGEFYYEPVQEHFSTHAKSALNFKVVLTKRAKSSFRGLIVLHKDAQKSEAYQENKNLLLSRSARADSEPRLEIIPNDVTCKHGSATAELDKKQLYYIMGRGFNEHQAKEMIVKSFCNAAFLDAKKELRMKMLEEFIPLITDHIFTSRSGILTA